MLEKTRGIVIKTQKYSETSLILKLFTERFGLLSFMVPGIRKAKGGRANLLQPGQLLEVDLYYRENKNFQRIREFKVSYIPEHIHRDIRRFAVLTFLLEVTGQLINEKEENEALFEYLFDAIVSIDQSEITGLYPIYQLMQLSRIMGFYPSDNDGSINSYFNMTQGYFQAVADHEDVVLDEPDSLLLRRLLEGEVAFAPSERSSIMELLLKYFRLHVPGFRELRSLDVLHTVLS